MKIKRKIVAAALQRLIGLLTFDELTAIYKAEQNAKHACAHLGMNAQIAAHDTVLTVAREIVEGLSDYQIDQMGRELNFYDGITIITTETIASEIQTGESDER